MSSYAQYDWSTVDMIEDPVVGLLLTKEMFFETYRTILHSLDGEDREFTVEYFFERSPVIRTQLRFVSDDVKEEWTDVAIAEACIPSLVEIREGENAADRTRRLHHVRPAPPTRKTKAPETMDRAKDALNVMRTVQQLDAKITLGRQQGADVRRLEEKRTRALLVLNKLGDVTL